jgi:hypothetical protein
VSAAHTSEPDMNPVIDGVVGRSLPGTLNVVSLGMIATGVAAFGTGLFAMGDGGVVAWGAFLVGVLYTLAISQGGVLFSVVQTATWGRWGRPLKRIAESFGFFLPVAWLLLVVFLLFGLRIYSWNPDTAVEGGPVALAPHSPTVWAAKETWLSPMFFRVRLALGVGFLILLDFVYLRASMRPDLHAGMARLGAKAPGWWKSFVGAPSGDLAATVAASQNTQTRLFGFIALTYAMVFSMVGFDLIMSLSPWWASNMFGAWTFVSSFWMSLAMLALVSMAGRDWLGVKDYIKPKNTHDLGKFMLAGTMFWAYTAYAQLLPIWYTDMPEETDYLLVRLFLPEWSWLSQLVGVMCFVAPFTILLSRGVKKMRWPLAGLASLILTGLFFERTLLVQPSIYHGDPRFNVLFWFVCAGTWLGFVGLWIQVVGRALASIPPVVVTDPHFEDHPWDVHVHALDHH